MAIIQTIKNFFKKKYNFFSITQVRNLKILNFKPLVILSLIVFFFMQITDKLIYRHSCFLQKLA